MNWPWKQKAPAGASKHELVLLPFYHYKRTLRASVKLCQVLLSSWSFLSQRLPEILTACTIYQRIIHNFWLDFPAHKSEKSQQKGFCTMTRFYTLKIYQVEQFFIAPLDKIIPHDKQPNCLSCKVIWFEVKKIQPDCSTWQILLHGQCMQRLRITVENVEKRDSASKQKFFCWLFYAFTNYFVRVIEIKRENTWFHLLY